MRKTDYVNTNFLNRNNIDKFSLFKDIGCSVVILGTLATVGVGIAVGASIVPLSVIAIGGLSLPTAAIASEQFGAVQAVQSAITEMRNKHYLNNFKNKNTI